ncbi:MAG TPA: ATP-binding protein [Erysipelotrichaceae bacterium]|nr:ATP-binding protein [Erysipelotrichaceae bacterium]
MQKLNVNVSLTDKQLEERKMLAEKLIKDKRVQTFLNEKNQTNDLVYEKVSMFETWCHNLDKCINCPGLHACKQDENGYVLSLDIDPLLNFELKPCRYQKDKLEQTAHKKYFVMQDIQDEYLLADVRKLLDVKADAGYLDSVKKIPVWLTDLKKGLYLFGSLGTGKTYLAMAILNYFAKQNKKVAFVSCPNFAYQFYSSYTEDDKREVKLEQLRNAYCIVLDDIGAETYSSYFRDEILFPLLNDRMEKHKLTIFTSNHDLSALANHFRYNQKGDDEALKSKRLIERIERLSDAHLIGGLNRRISR